MPSLCTCLSYRCNFSGKPNKESKIKSNPIRKLAVILSLVILAIASDVGSQPDRNLTWKDVYCTKGGKYAVTVHCKTNPNTKAELIVNGRKHTATILSDDMTTVSYLVTLQKGTNVITFGKHSYRILVTIPYSSLKYVFVI